MRTDEPAVDGDVGGQRVDRIPMALPDETESHVLQLEPSTQDAPWLEPGVSPDVKASMSVEAHPYLDAAEEGDAPSAPLAENTRPIASAVPSTERPADARICCCWSRSSADSSFEEGLLPPGKVEESALEPGGTVKLFTMTNIGWSLTYITAGCLTQGVVATQYGLFVAYLNAPGYIVNAANAAAILPYSLTWFFAILSDTCPIYGYRRKPHVCMGFALSAFALLLLSLKQLPGPYFCQGDDAGVDSSGNPKICNPDAPDAASGFVYLMAMSVLGVVWVVVSINGLTTQYARREPLAQRGATQTISQVFFVSGNLLAQLIVGFGMNGPEYNGVAQPPQDAASPTCSRSYTLSPPAHDPPGPAPRNQQTNQPHP